MSFLRTWFDRFIPNISNAVDSSDPVKYEAALSLLMEHVADKRWREVFLLVVERSDDAGYVLSWMKLKIDSILAGDEDLQKFLVWVKTKAASVDASYKPAAVRAFYFALALALADRKLSQQLQQLRDQLLNDSNDLKKWWKSNGQSWIEQFRQVMIEHRNIGHDWQFSESQKELLQNYHDANKLLSDCVKSECYANRQVLQHIEDTLLLPFEN